MDGGVPRGDGADLIIVVVNDGQREELVADLFRDDSVGAGQVDEVASVDLGREVVAWKGDNILGTKWPS